MSVCWAATAAAIAAAATAAAVAAATAAATAAAAATATATATATAHALWYVMYVLRGMAWHGMAWRGVLAQHNKLTRCQDKQITTSQHQNIIASLRRNMNHQT